LEDNKIRKQAEEVYEKLLSNGVEILYDDREGTTAGQKFSDFDLLGIPYRAVISQKTNGKIELKKRESENVDMLSLDELLNQLK